MQCPKCGGRGYVYATKPNGQVKQRYRQCRICGHRFVTWEEVEDREIRSFKKTAPRGLFEENEGKAGD
ncbi:MAG: ogr/Delta-like zinc finger family protein [Paenirhodobacter sp.]|uniref:ogr/Delta-like zinc finger family protein n=1 Tax=Paenirhodobacter sp. TaxID=1965326 RepID=UPI003D11FDF7